MSAMTTLVNAVKSAVEKGLGEALQQALQISMKGAAEWCRMTCQAGSALPAAPMVLAKKDPLSHLLLWLIKLFKSGTGSALPTAAPPVPTFLSCHDALLLFSPFVSFLAWVSETQLLKTQLLWRLEIESENVFSSFHRRRIPWPHHRQHMQHCRQRQWC
jgi:hypothetical protein